MATRGGSLAVVAWSALATGSCVDEPVVHGRFSPEVWDAIRSEHRLAPLATAPPCSPDPGDDCALAAMLGQALFFDDQYADAKRPDPMVPAIAVSCADCHDPKTAFANRTPSSQGTGWTGRNSLSVLNLAYRADQGHVYLWDGEKPDLRDVLDIPVASRGAMNTTPRAVAERIRAVPAYWTQYLAAFGTPVNVAATDAWVTEVYEDAKSAFAAYQYRLTTGDARFDRFLDGTAPFSELELDGLAVFVGQCQDCHAGPLFADHELHNIGVAQTGEHAATVDYGYADTVCPGEQATCGDAIGRFRTPTLRNVALSAPYMHAGQLASLDDVLWFYAEGGDTAQFVGTKDERMAQLELSADDMLALGAFLATLTSDTPVPLDLTCAVPPCAP